MIFRVQLDSKCESDFGDLTTDSQALIVEYMRWLREQLVETEGRLPDSGKVQESNGETTYSWSDSNWYVTYKMKQHGNFLTGRYTMIRITRIQLMRR